MKVAAIDIGTNSVLLLIAERSADGLEPCLERACITRLGAGVDRTQQLSPEASQRTLACLGDYAQLIALSRVERVAVVGTSALRDAQGAGFFLDAAEKLLGVRPVVISGSREAALAFSGALSGLKAHGEVNVVDIGGGSTEIVRGSAGPPRQTHQVCSLNIGSVRLTERFVRNDPPAASELLAIRELIRAELLSVPEVSPSATLVGVAGTVTQLAALQLGMVQYNAAAVHGSALTAAHLEAQSRQLAGLSAAERRRLPGMEPARADVIVAGALIVSEILSWSKHSSLIVSDRGVRWGLAAELAGLG